MLLLVFKEKTMIMILSLFYFMMPNFAHTAQAAPLEAADNLDDLFLDCMNRSGGITINMMNCSGEKIYRQEADMKQLLIDIKKRYPLKELEKLEKRQKLWHKLTDRKCLSQIKNEDGSLSGIMYNLCIIYEMGIRDNRIKKEYIAN